MSRQFLDYSVAITTPFTKEGDFDGASVPQLVKYYVEDLKFPGLLISGSTGEQHCMTIAERKEYFKLVQESVPKDYPVYAGVATFKTKDAIELIQAAESVGIAGIMLGLPPYRIPSQAELQQYVIDVAQSTRLPIFLYNNPRRNGCFIEPTNFATIVSKAKNVVGMKEAGNSAFVPEIRSLLKEAEQFNFFTGTDVTFINEYVNFGYTGLTSIYANVFPREMQQLVDHVKSNQIDQANDILNALKPKIDIIVQVGVLPSIKYILRQRGLPAGYCPAPLMDPTEEQKKLLSDFI